MQKQKKQSKKKKKKKVSNQLRASEALAVGCHVFRHRVVSRPGGFCGPFPTGTDVGRSFVASRTRPGDASRWFDRTSRGERAPRKKPRVSRTDGLSEPFFCLKGRTLGRRIPRIRPFRQKRHSLNPSVHKTRDSSPRKLSAP